MLASKSYIGKRLDMEHYKNVQFDRSVTLFDEDDSEFNLGSESVIFEFFAKAHGKSLEVFDLGPQIGNEIVLQGQILDYRPSHYFHECYQMSDTSPSEKILLFYGVSEVI